MKNKTTKYALMSSVTAIILCVVMLMGVTFAWFSDSANTGVNIIRSGSFDLDLLNSEGKSIDNTMLDWIKEEGQTEVIWRPGCTYQLPDITIVNKGNLELKYSIIFNGLDGDAELLDVITFTVMVDGKDVDLKDYEGKLSPEESNVLVIKGHMDENAGIEYQDMTINSLSITVQSTQINGNLENENQSGSEDPEQPGSDETTNPIAEVYKTLEGADADPKEFSGANNVQAKTFVNVKASDKTPVISFLEVTGLNVDNVIVIDEGNTDLMMLTLKKGSYTVNNKFIVNNSDTEIKMNVTYPVVINGEEITSADGLEDYISGSVTLY